MTTAVDTAAASQSALSTLRRQRDLVEGENPTYRRLVAEYEHRLAESLDDRAQLRTQMHAFGRYLRGRGVLPEHIVLCVHAALKDGRTSRDLIDLGSLGQEIVRWTIEGYYSDALPG